ncbi:MAG: hypothetical protein K0M56_02280 [Kaistella sp.]|nr:hypothetical protein [Kaistella sp.]
MVRNKKIALFCLVQLLMLINCSGFGTEKKIYWKYYLVAIDTDQSCALSYKLDSGSYLGITPDGVVQFAETEQYIVTKNLIASEVEYYIFPKIKTDEFTFEKYLIGPLTQSKLKLFTTKNKLALKFVSAR